MRTDPHHVTISPRHTSPNHGSSTPVRRYPSTGAATRGRTIAPSSAAPVLIHSNSDPAADDDSHLDARRVLFIHGQPGSALIWMNVLPLLREYGLHTFAVRQRGDDQMDGDAVDQFTSAAALGRLLDEQQRPPAVIVGHGSGAGLALALAATAPRHVRALVLIAPTTGLQTISGTDRVLATPILGPSLAWLGFQAAGLALRIGPRRDLIMTKLADQSNRDAKQLARRLTARRTWRNFVGQQRRLVTYARCLHRGLNRLNCPILIVAGTHDHIAIPRVIDALSRRLPGSQTTTTDAGHLIPIDDPDAVVAAILRALRIDYRNSRCAISAHDN